MGTKLRQYKLFFVIVIFTTVVWLAVALSTSRTYEDSIEVEYVGVDTAKYIIVDATEEIPLTVESDGYASLFHHLIWRNKGMKVDLSEYVPREISTCRLGYTIVTESYVSEIRKQFSPNGEYTIQIGIDTLRVQLNERHSKVFEPELRDVSFSFPVQYGLVGQPELQPAEIELYGSEESLSQIHEVHTKPAMINVSNSECRVKLALDPVWKKYSDVRASHDTVLVRIPVGAYVEKKFDLPVIYDRNDEHQTVKLYPPQVMVTTLVPKSEDVDKLIGTMVAKVNLGETNEAKTLQVQVDNFPSNVRIKSIEPSTIQYVIIK